MKIIRKGLSVVALAAFILGLFMTAGATAQVTVTAVGSYTETTVRVDIYANTGGESLRSFGVSLTDPNNGTLTSPVATIDPAWELQSTDTTVPGQVVLIGGNLDAADPTAGIQKPKVLLGTVSYTRNAAGDPPPFGLVVGLGRDEVTFPNFANFVNVAGTELDSTVVFTMAAGVGVAEAYLLWTNPTTGRVGIWPLDASSNHLGIGDNNFGPIAGWSGQSYQRLPDGTARLLWTSTGGKAGLWTLDVSGAHVGVDNNFGPFAGWMATSYQMLGDGTAKMLWTSTSGKGSIWTLDASGTHLGAQDRTWGPYAGWKATSYQQLADGTAKMLWTSTSGKAGLWTLDAAGAHIAAQDRNYGPFAGWSAQSYHQFADGTAKMIWTSTSGKTSIWSFDAAGNHDFAQDRTYGPFAGWMGTSYEGM